MYAVAIDGPAGAGKSTISRVAAQKLGFLYVDTGALYRAVAYDILQNGIDPNDSCAVCKRLDSITVGFGYENDNQQIYLNGNNITEKNTDSTGFGSGFYRFRHSRSATFFIFSATGYCPGK